MNCFDSSQNQFTVVAAETKECRNQRAQEEELAGGVGVGVLW